MSDERPPSDHPPDDSLDHLLREAADVSLNPAQLSRLEATWDGITSKRRRMRRIAGVSVVMLACVILGSAWRFSRYGGGRSPETATVPGETNRLHREMARLPNQLSIDVPSSDELREGRQHHSAYEEVVVAIADLRIQSALDVNRTETLEASLQAIEIALDQPAESGEMAAIVRPLLGSPEYETLLVNSDALRDCDSRRGRAAAVLLAEIASPRSLSTLLAMLAAPDCPDHVLRGVVRLANVETLARLAQTNVPRRVQHALTVGLLQKDGPGLGAYLQLVKSPRSCASALSAAGELSPNQVDSLLAWLDAPRVADRLAAALVMGHIDDGRVVEALASRVVRNESRFEALIALASSKDPRAARFLAAAQESVLLSASVRAARNRARQLRSS